MFKEPKEKANACGICFEDAGVNSFPYPVLIAL
jgi:hypothetical protein